MNRPEGNPDFSSLKSRFQHFASELFARTTRAVHWLNTPVSQHRTGTWLLLRLLGLCHLVAFLSLDMQVEGLLGEKGILPVQPWMNSLEQQLGLSRLWRAPTLCWLGASDGFLHGICRAGSVLGLLVSLGIAVRPCLTILWMLYLSVVTAGTLFMGYQWDALLVEATFLAIFVAPKGFRPAGPGSHPGPPRIALWVLGWLLLRLMFLSGAVKLLSEDKLWRSMTALSVHYQTQPLPTPLAWWAHQLPEWVHVLSCGTMFAIELVCPWLLLAGRLGRHLAAGAFITLMALVAATGNYCFFNLLVAAMCLPFFDDRFWTHLRAWLPEKWSSPEGPSADNSGPRPSEGGARGLESLWRVPWQSMTAGVLIFVFWASFLQTGIQLFRWRDLPRWFAYPLELASPFRLANPYGLFAVMTERRPEIAIQGSEDGKNWKEYGFKWKAGEPGNPPRFVAPHQPRVDWQMWFASLGQLRNNPWFSNFMLRILQGEPSVLSLLEHNPFPEKPPRLLRAVLFQYRFTSPEERADSGAWWQRDDRGDYCPPVTLSGQR